jgi:hypothetical protein
MYKFYVHVTMHRNKFPFNKTKPNRFTSFLKFILEMKLYMFRTFPLSIIRSYLLYTQQWYMSYRFVDSFRAAAAAGSGGNNVNNSSEIANNHTNSMLLQES